MTNSNKELRALATIAKTGCKSYYYKLSYQQLYAISVRVAGYYGCDKKKLYATLKLCKTARKEFKSVLEEGKMLLIGYKKTLNSVNDNFDKNHLANQYKVNEVFSLAKVIEGERKKEGRRQVSFIDIPEEFSSKQVASIIIYFLATNANMSNTSTPLTSIGKSIGEVIYPTLDSIKQRLYGRQLVEIALDSSMCFDRFMNVKNNRKVEGYKIKSDLIDQLDDLALEVAESNAFPLPMTTKPKNWVYDSSTRRWEGGYNNIQYPLIRGREKQAGEFCNKKNIIGTLNSIQSVPFRINKAVYDEVKRTLVKPVKPDEKLSRAAYKKYVGEIGKYSALKFGLEIAAKYVNEKEIYFPHNYDYRGRVYPIPVVFNTQSSKEFKGMLEFANGEYLTDEGREELFAYLASTFGRDKENKEDRIRIGKELFRDNISYLEANDSFVYFQVFNALKDGNEGKKVHCAIHLDGSCNGLQHASALTKCDSGAKLVNMTDTEDREDIYEEVAKLSLEACTDEVVKLLVVKLVESERKLLIAVDEAEKDEVKEFYRNEIKTTIAARQLIEVSKGEVLRGLFEGKQGRALAKRPTMIKPYSGTLEGMKKYVNDEVLNINDLLTNKLIISFVTGLIFNSINTVVFGGEKREKWLQVAGVAIGKEGKNPKWTTPDGFKVNLKNYKREVITMRINVRGKRKKVSIADYSDVVDFNKIKSNISPNLIHSLDATHLRLTLMSMVNKGVNNVWFIHDSFASHPNYTVVLNKTIRDEFIALYSRGFAGDIESQFSAQTKKALKPLPIVGDFDVKNVRFNPHFFS